MAFADKTDYFSLGDSNIIIVSSEQNKSIQVAQAKDDKGDVVAQETFGEIEAPTCSYVFKGNATTASMQIGKAITTSGKKYTITSIQIDTAAGSPPTMSVSGEEVTTTGTHSDCYYTVPQATIQVCHHAQTLWSAFTLTGTGCYLIGASYTASGSLTKATKNGDTIAYDIADGQLVASLTIQQSGSTEPTITEGSDWVITTPLSKSEPDAEYPTWTCTLTKPLKHSTSTSST